MYVVPLFCEVFFSFTCVLIVLSVCAKVQQNREGASLEPIHGVVTPDLPIKASLVEFLQTFDISHVRQLLQHTKSTKEEKQNRSVAESHSGIGNGLQGFNCWQVNTVAAQTRSMPEICKRMVNSAQEIDSAGSGGALLLLSGGTKPYFLNPLLSDIRS